MFVCVGGISSRADNHLIKPNEHLTIRDCSPKEPRKLKMEWAHAPSEEGTWKESSLLGRHALVR